MKEATGELSGTVIAIVAIAAVAAIFTTLILPMIQRNIELSSACEAAGTRTYTTTLEDGSTIECSAGVCTLTQTNGRASTKACVDE